MPSVDHGPLLRAPKAIFLTWSIGMGPGKLNIIPTSWQHRNALTGEFSAWNNPVYVNLTLFCLFQSEDDTHSQEAVLRYLPPA